jgi:hypothetical protein
VIIEQWKEEWMDIKKEIMFLNMIYRDEKDWPWMSSLLELENGYHWAFAHFFLHFINFL